MINFSELRIGEDYIVSLNKMNKYRDPGSIFKVYEGTTSNSVTYGGNRGTNSYRNQDFRMATQEEIAWHLKDPRAHVNIEQMPKVVHLYPIY